MGATEQAMWGSEISAGLTLCGILTYCGGAPHAVSETTQARRKHKDEFSNHFHIELRRMNQ